MQAQLSVDAPLQGSSPIASVARAVLIGGASVGVLDAADGVVWAGVSAGQNPVQVLQWIATGLLGPAAFEGGLAAAGLGALMHFSLSYAFTAVFVVAYTRIEALRTHWVTSGLAWGAAVWALMNLVILPRLPVPQSGLTPGAVVNGVLGHALTVGLVAAYVARRFSERSGRDGAAFG